MKQRVAAIMSMILPLCAPLAAFSADDLKVSQLEQEIRTLQREVSAQSRQLDELRRQLGRIADQRSIPGAPVATPALAPPNTQWLEASRWKQIKAGMSELEVINLLGAPASMRAANQERLLLYAMEVGATGFLTGSVTFREGVVVTVKTPTLQ
jgi:hypothetical protein